jgi:hypothetical protein
MIGFGVWERRGGNGRNVTFPAPELDLMTDGVENRHDATLGLDDQPHIPSRTIGARLTSCEILVHGSNRDRALAHRFGHAFD